MKIANNFFSEPIKHERTYSKCVICLYIVVMILVFGVFIMILRFNITNNVIYNHKISGHDDFDYIIDNNCKCDCTYSDTVNVLIKDINYTINCDGIQDQEVIFYCNSMNNRITDLKNIIIQFNINYVYYRYIFDQYYNYISNTMMIQHNSYFDNYYFIQHYLNVTANEIDYDKTLINSIYYGNLNQLWVIFQNLTISNTNKEYIKNSFIHNCISENCICINKEKWYDFIKTNYSLYYTIICTMNTIIIFFINFKCCYKQTNNREYLLDDIDNDKQ